MPNITLRLESAPSAPVQNDPTGLSYDRVTLNWSVPGGLTIQSFFILKDGLLLIDELPLELRSYEVTLLDPDTVYDFVIGAVNGAGNSVFSNTKTVTTDSVPDGVIILSQPQNKSAQDGDTVQFAVVAQYATSYQWQENSGSGWSDIISAATSTYSFTATSAKDGYQYRCIVSNDVGSVASNAATLTILASGLAAPTGLTATLIAGPAVQLDWTDNASGETGYKVYRNGSGTPLATIAADSTTYTDSTVASGNSYSYYVAAYDGNGDVPSSSVNISLVEASVLFSPTDEFVADGQTATFGVTVDPIVGSATYQWEVSTNSGSSWADVSGATTRTLQVVGDNATNNGNWYRCKITTGAGTVTSGHAVLTSYAHTYHLDTNTAIAAWSYQKVRAAYAGDCVRLKRTEDSVEADFGFSGDYLDIASIETWAQGSSATVVTRYDQSGNGRDLTISGTGPTLVTDGVVNVDYKGFAYDVATDRDSYFSADFTSSPLDGDSFSYCLLSEVDADLIGTITFESGTFPLVSMGTYGTSPISTSFEGVSVPAAKEPGLSPDTIDADGKKHKFDMPRIRPGWSCVTFRSGRFDAFAGTERVNLSEEQWYVNRTSGHTGFWLGAIRGLIFRELVLYGSSKSDNDIIDAGILADRNYRYGPPNRNYKNLSCVYAENHKLYQFLDGITEDKITLPQISSKTASSVTVSGVDWSFIPSNHRIVIHRGTFTSSDVATFDGTDTTIPLQEDTSSIAVGDQVLPDPYYDQSLTDIDEINALYREWGSDSSPEIRGVGGHKPHYYLLTDPSATISQISPTHSAVVDSANPDSTGLTGGVYQYNGRNKIVYYQFDLSSIADRPEYARIMLTGITHGAPDENRLFAGIKIESGSFNPATITWNTMPIAWEKMRWPTVVSSTTSTITIGPCDWSDYPTNKTLIYVAPTGSIAYTQTFQITGAALSGENTILTVANDQDASGVTPGMTVIAKDQDLFGPSDATSATKAISEPETNNVFDCWTKFQELYDAGATTAVVAVFPMTDINTNGYPATQKEAVISSAELLAVDRFHIGCDRDYGLFELDDHTTGNKNQHLQTSSQFAPPYLLSIPLADGKQGNPFYNCTPLAARAVAHHIANLSQISSGLDVYGDARVGGGKMHLIGWTMQHFAHLLDEATQIAAEELVYTLAKVAKNCIFYGDLIADNGNVTMKGIEGAAQCWAGTRSSNTRLKTILKEHVSRVLFGTDNGQIDTVPYDYDPDHALFKTWGNVPEGNTHPVKVDPEIDYGGRSFAHKAAQDNATQSDSDWDVFHEATKRIVKFWAGTMMSDGSYGWLSAAGFSGRTDGAPYYISQYTNFGLFAVSAIHSEARWMCRNQKSISDPPAAYIYVTGEESAANAEAARVIRNVANPPVLEDMVYGPSAGSRTFPSTFDQLGRSGQCWPSLPSENPTVSGWSATIRALLEADDSSTYYPGHMKKNWTDKVEVLGDPDYYDAPVVLIQKGSSPKYKALLYAPEIVSNNGGCKMGHVDLWEVEDYGPVLSCVKISSKSDLYGIPSSAYSKQFHDATDIIAQNASDAWARFSHGGDEILPEISRTWDPVTNTLTHVRPMSVDDANENNYPSDMRWIYTGAIRVMDPTGADPYHGIEWSINLDYTAGAGGTDQYKELVWQIPLFVQKDKTTASLVIDYWTGNNWIPILKRGEWTTNTIQWLRVRRDRLDGSGENAAYFKLGSARNIYIWDVDTFKNWQYTRRLWINLHSNRGTATNIPANISETLELVPGDPGLTSGGTPEGVILTVLAGDTLKSGMIWDLTTYVGWAGRTPTAVTYEYSTDYSGDEGAATWASIGTATPDSGSNGDGQYTFVGGSIPSSVTGVRVVLDSVDVANQTAVIAVTTTAATSKVVDTFTDSDAVSLEDHAPDTDVEAGGWIDPEIETTKGFGTMTITSNRILAAQNTSSNGSFRAISVGASDWQIEGKVTASAWVTDATSGSGPWLGGRCKGRSTQGLGVRLYSSGVWVRAFRNNQVQQELFDGFTPVAGTTYLLKVRATGSKVAFALFSSDGVTQHLSGKLENLPTLDNPEPAIGFTKASVGNQHIDDVTIKV